MKISYYPDIFCLFRPISHLKYLRWRRGGGGGGGQSIPAGLSCTPTQIFEQWLAMDLVIAVNCFDNYKQIRSTKYRYCLLVYKNQFLEIHPYTGGGQHILAGLPYPHLRFWNGDCLQIMKWLWSITLFKMMKISYNPDFFCLFTPISHLKYLQWWVGGNLSQLVYLAPHPDFEQWLAIDLVIALNCFNNYKRICFTKYRYCLLVYIPVSWNSSIYRWGATYPSWFTLPPTQDFGVVTVYR